MWTVGDNVFRTDPEKLRLILSNLMSNAIEFSRERGIIELQAKRDGNMLVFSVRDYGIGFSMESETIVFERFRQLDTGARRRHRGHGLGLSITKDLVDLFGGTISVVSAHDKGSVFSVSVPEAEQTEGIDTFSDDGNVFHLLRGKGPGEQIGTDGGRNPRPKMLSKAGHDYREPGGMYYHYCARLMHISLPMGHDCGHRGHEPLYASALER